MACRVLLALSLIAGVAASPGKFDRTLPRLNARVVCWAWTWHGEQVGNGECWTLADRALLVSGARRPGRGGLGLYEYGRELAPGERLLPGDVMQMEGAVFLAADDAGRRYRQRFGHHTAVVLRVSGTRLAVLHSNHDGDRRVRLGFIDLALRTEGGYHFFRPEPATDEE